LGRNSSGKSSLLKAINYLEVLQTPSNDANFKNFNDAGTASHLKAGFDLEGSQLDFGAFEKRFRAALQKLMVDQAAIDGNPKIARIVEGVSRLYQELIQKINDEQRVVMWKLGDGSYHFAVDDKKSYENRKNSVVAAITAAKQSDGSISINGANRVIDLTFRTFEDQLFYQFPNIGIFNENHPLNQSLPDRIDEAWADEENEFTKRFVEYLGADKINRFFVANDPEEREALWAHIRVRLSELLKQINHTAGRKSDLISMRIDPTMDGLQITVITDGKKSFYSHLSDNTKFLFAYHLHAHVSNISNNILLFDEPNNGFHSTAQIQMLKFLKDLSANGNQVIVSTHSEYLLDPDSLTSVRIMSKDKDGSPVVRNHFYNQTKATGDYLALQPIFDAIGYKYGNQLEVQDRVIVTEGVTDLLYLRAFKKIFKQDTKLNIAPGRGDGTIGHLIPFLVSQGLSLKVIIDTGQAKASIQSAFEISDKYVFEIPVPAAFAEKCPGSGIEDLLSKADFEKLLSNIGHTPTGEFSHISNSVYMGKIGGNLKRIVAHSLYENAETMTKDEFDSETVLNFEQVLEFCNNDDWFAI
jgi:energy-coupling factor transporter ATP-binding protein EcfA2